MGARETIISSHSVSIVMSSTLLVSNADLIVTMRAPGDILRRESIYVRDGVIAGIGDRGELLRLYGEPDDEVDAEGMLVAPGFYDMHTHVVMAGFRGLAADRAQVIYKVFWPLERALDGDAAFRLAMLGGLEALRSGVVLVADHYFFMDSIARALRELGLRGLLGHTYMDWKGPWTGEAELRRAEEFLRRWRRDRLVRPVVAPHAPDTVSRENLMYLKGLAEEYNTFLHMHLAQSRVEFEDVRRRYGETPVRFVYGLGLLGPRSIVAHCNYADREEVRLLAHSGALVAQCPSTYMLGGVGFPAFDVWQLGGRVVLGTDAPCYNDNTDFFEEMRLLVYGQRFQHGRDDLWTAWDVLEIATRRAAEYLGVRGGVIAPGYRGDLVLVRLDRPHMRPLFDPYSNLVYAAGSGDVDTVVVDGRVVVRGGRHTVVDEERVLELGEGAARDVARRALEESPELENILGRVLLG